MKWLVTANIILLSTEVYIEATQFSRVEKKAACFVGSRPSHAAIHHSTQMDANPYPTIGPRISGNESACRQHTALSMGIRSMLGLGGKNPKDDDGKSENPEDIKAALEAIKADLEAVTAEENKTAKAALKKKKLKAEVKIPEVQKKKKITNSRLKQQETAEPTSADTYGETVRDRINRVKSGQMTDEEKAAFLNSALTRTPPGSNGPPIRQAIPSVNSSSPKRSSSASPFPKDALWNTLVSNGKSSSSGNSSTKYGNVNLTGNDDSAKREYLDMVTNPDRFKSYAAMGGYRSSTASSDSDSVEEDSKGNVVEDMNMPDVPVLDDPEGGLASRLQSAAIQKERQDAEAKAKKEEEEMAHKAKLQEEQRRRAEESQRIEEEKLAAKRAVEEEKLEAEQNARKAEDKRLADMQAAQDAYWANKLVEENSRKERSLSKEEKASLEQQRRLETEALLASAAKEAAKKAEIEMLRDEERRREDPHESVILKEAFEDDLLEREKNAEIIEQSSAFVSNTTPQGRADDVSANAFVEQQGKKKAALDEFMKEQSDRLASLNSPLPFLPRTPKVQSNPTASKTKSPDTIPSLNLTDLTMKKSKTTSANSKPISPPAPRLNLADLTMAKKNTAPSPAPAPANSSPRLSLAEMTMLKKPQAGGTPPSTPRRNKTPFAPSSGSKPIRQNIPINNNEEEEDDFFEYSRGGGKSGMSLKDIMAKENVSDVPESKKTDAAKNLSKKWGIDIDKFTD